MEKTIQLYVIIPVYNVERYIRRCFDRCVIKIMSMSHL